MRIRNNAWVFLLPVLLTACVSSKKFKSLQAKNDELSKANSALQQQLKDCNDLKKKGEDALSKQSSDDKSAMDALRKQIDFLRNNNTQALKQLEDMSVISSSQAESIQKSLQNLGAKDAYIRNLQEELAHKDSMNLALVSNLKGAVGDLNDQDINIKVDKGVVYIDISDKLLFNSGSYEVTAKARRVLGKVAMVLKNQPDLEFMVEGHTDSRPFRRGELLDNWDLSVKRATSVVRILQHQYGLPAAHIEAAGKGEYLPVDSNSTKQGRAANRRTRIIVLPQLDQFFKLLEKK